MSRHVSSLNQFDKGHNLTSASKRGGTEGAGLPACTGEATVGSHGEDVQIGRGGRDWTINERFIGATVWFLTTFVVRVRLECAH
jgi:hypothetical protein